MNQKTNTAAVYGGISGSTLKIIAMVSMLIDHIGAVVLEPILLSRGFASLQTEEQINTFLADNSTVYWADVICRNLIGRMAFPIFCFLLIQGFMHTHSRAKYLRNLFLFALISEIPFDLAIKSQVLEFSSQNVMFTLAIGLATIWALEYLNSSRFSKGLQTFLTLLAAIAGALAALLLHSDYSFFGVLTIVIMYMFRTRPFLCGAVGCVTLTMMSYGEFTSFLSLIPLRKYNGTRGMDIKYAFYAFYPVHLLILCGIAYLIV